MAICFSFQPSNHLQRYHLYANGDYTQLPVELISPLNKTTIACESGPDVGLVDIARHQSKIFFLWNHFSKFSFYFRTWNFESQ
jgi:hypothetical protein